MSAAALTERAARHNSDLLRPKQAVTELFVILQILLNGWENVERSLRLEARHADFL